jgi:hypothetical protein
MNKLPIVTLVLAALTFLGVGYLSYERFTHKATKTAAATADSFKDDESKYATDLVGKSVSLPQGQLWGFNWDQQITVTQVNKKVLDENTVLVVVDVKAIAKLTPPPASSTPAPKDKDKATPAKEPKVATLAGYCKLLYERVNGQWFLTSTEGISLKVTAE